MSFGPQKLELKDLWVVSLWALIAWVTWSILLIVLVFVISSFLDVWSTFSAARTGAWELNSIFPLVLSVITFLVTSITVFVTYSFLHFASPDRYKKNIIILGQIAFFTFLIYIFMAPVYIYAGLIDYDYIMIIFLFHTLIAIFWTSLILEILNNYRYVLVSVYGSFVWLFFSIIIVALIFSSFESGQAKLISLLFLLPLINFTQVFFKGVFDLLYFYYNKLTNQDQIWDIFYQIELEEKEALREEEEKNSI
jgi:hypothetical protein